MRLKPFIPRAQKAITVSAAFIIASPAVSAPQPTKFAMSVPPGFENLTAERTAVLDIYFGGRSLGEAQASIQPGSVKFANPESVARLIPGVKPGVDLTSALSGPLPSNVALACIAGRRSDCGVLEPKNVGVILNEDQFRVDIFLNPLLLSEPDESARAYLPDPEDRASFVSLFGGTVSASSHGDRSYHLQNRSIASVGAMRLRSDSSLANRQGLSFDNLTLEADRADWRYVGGIFWAPATDLVGRRRILGVGVTTQLDTRSDRNVLLSTPLTVFLQTPARIEVHVNGRLISSGIYPAGQRLVETAQLPSGSYEVLLKVKEDGRPAREERRFFTKGTQLAPMGRPLLSGFLGLLPAADRGLSLTGKTIFYQATAAYRVSEALGIDGSLLGTQKKAIIEGGLSLHTPFAQFRLGALASTTSDLGVVVRASSTGRGKLAFNFDLRKVKSRTGGPLLPLSSSKGSFSEETKSGVGDQGTYLQALGLVSYRLGNALMRFTGSYRRDALHDTTYSISAALDVPIVRTAMWEAVFQTEVRRTERDIGSFVGLRFHASKGTMAFSGSAGHSRTGKGAGSKRIVGEAQASWHRQFDDYTYLAAEGAYGRDTNGTFVRAGGHLRSSIANGRADILHHFGDSGSTQVTANTTFGITTGGGRVLMAGRQLNDAAVVVSVSGDPNQTYEVMVDEVVSGVVSGGESLSLFLHPYRTYGVRLRPRGGAPSNYDTASKQITLYPGNVAMVEWKTKSVAVLYGRAVDSFGKPVSNANITGTHGISRTDLDGFFQVETSKSDMLRVVDRTGRSCTITFPVGQSQKAYISAGDILCR